MANTISIEALLRRLFLVSLAAAVALTVVCYAILSQAHRHQLQSEQRARVNALLEAQYPFLFQELVNDRFYAAATRGREIREEFHEIEVGVYRTDGTVVYETETLTRLRNQRGFASLEKALPNHVLAQRAIDFADEPIGNVVFALPRTSTVPKTLTTALWLMLGVLLLVMATLFWYLRLISRRYVLEPLRILNDALPSLASYLDGQTKELRFRSDLGSLEFNHVAVTLRAMTAKLRVALAQQKRAQLRSERAAAIAEVSHQVAHDIRSPLTALSIAIQDLSALPEAQRSILRGAAARITDIANNLLSQNDDRLSTTVGVDTAKAPSAQLLPVLIESLLSEKRMQFKERPGVRIISRWEGVLYDAFGRVEPSLFARALSNVVNNAVEAIADDGTVEVVVSCCAETLEVHVHDDGVGIPAEVLPDLTRRGATFGKEGGSGLGLFFARTVIERWGGSVHIESDATEGTDVRIRIPRVGPPRWFVPSLQFSPGDTVVVLDDDESIHQVWRKRFEEEAIGWDLTIHHFHAATQFEAWVFDNVEAAKRATFLVDFELLNGGKNGLELIRELNIASQSVLVTSRFEEQGVVEESMSLGLRLIPKSLSGMVPLHRTDERLPPDGLSQDLSPQF